MTPFLRFLRNTKEKLFGTYYQGPEAPASLHKAAVLFSNTHPYATRADWVEFAARNAEEGYRLGYVRGYEHAERDPEPFRSDLPPDLVADLLDPAWRESPPVDLLHNAGGFVPDLAPTDADVIRQELDEHVLRHAKESR